MSFWLKRLNIVCSFFETLSHCVVQVGPEFVVILLPQPLEAGTIGVNCCTMLVVYFKIYQFILYALVFCLHVCLCEGVRSSGTRVTDSC